MRMRIRLLLILLLANSLVLAGQTRRFTSDDIEYELELPSSAWQVVSRVDVHDHPEFVNGNDPSNGYLRIRKILLAQPASASELFRQQERLELQQLSGYVVCSECDGVQFSGRLAATAFSYEYVSGGRCRYGRIYYIRIDERVFYALHFTVARDQLPVVSEAMESIVRSFRLK